MTASHKVNAFHASAPLLQEWTHNMFYEKANITNMIQCKNPIGGDFLKGQKSGDHAYGL